MTGELAWAAGLFDGSGTATICDGRFRLALRSTDGATVMRFHSALGGSGRVYGPYANDAAEKDGHPRRQSWMWVVEGAIAYDVAETLWPLLGTARRKQLTAARERDRVRS